MKPKEIIKFTEELRNITFLKIRDKDIRKELTKLKILINDIFKLVNSKYAKAYEEEPILEKLRKS